MPRINVKPLIKLTKEQWKVLFERGAEKAGKVTPQTAGAIMGRPFEPGATKEFGTLYGTRSMGAGETVGTVEHLPIAEARAKYQAAPEQFTTPRYPQSLVKQIRPVPPGSSEELAGGLAYEHIKDVPVNPPKSRTSSLIRQELEKLNTEEAMKRTTGLSMEDIRPGVSPKTVMEERGIKPKDVTVQLAPAEELAAYEKIAEELWRNSGGSRSSAGKIWERWRAASRASGHIFNGRDYFISSLVRWKDNPTKFKRAFPREAAALEKLWNEFEMSLNPRVAIPGTNLPGQAGGGVVVGGGGE